MTSIVTRAALIVASLALYACAAESVSEPSTPEVQQRQLSQLSAGGGIACYDFYASIDGTNKRIGSLLVIEDAFGGGYDEETEYWRFDPLAIDDLAAGDIAEIGVDFIGKSKSFDGALVDHFEADTGEWQAWNVNRLFDLATDPTFVWNDPPAGHVLYRMEGRGWGKANGKKITYYLEFEFTGQAYPEMSWYIDYDDFQSWQEARGDDNRIYEVRLNHATNLQQAPFGVGFELKTIK